MKMVKDYLESGAVAVARFFDITILSVFLWLAAFVTEGNIALISSSIDRCFQHPET